MTTLGQHQAHRVVSDQRSLRTRDLFPRSTPEVHHLCYAVPSDMKTARNPQTTISFHDRRLAERMEDPDFRAEFERASREITAIDAIVNALDSLRATQGFTKAELAREIGKNPASVRRLLTAQSNPELRTVVAADALDADVVIVPRSRRRKPARGASAAA